MPSLLERHDDTPPTLGHLSRRIPIQEHLAFLPPLFGGLLTPGCNMEMLSIAGVDAHVGVGHDESLASRKKYQMLPLDCSHTAFIVPSPFPLAGGG